MSIGSYGAFKAAEAERLAARNLELERAMREIETICTESASALRKRMGTRVGNVLTIARAALGDAAAIASIELNDRVARGYLTGEEADAIGSAALIEQLGVGPKTPVPFDDIERGWSVLIYGEWQKVTGVDIDGFVRVDGDIGSWLPMSLIERARP